MLMVTGPVASHTISSAAYRIGIPMRRAVRDDLANIATSQNKNRP